MWRKIILITICLTMFVIMWFYIEHKLKEMAAFKFSSEYVINQYKEDGNLTNGGIRKDVGRGNYSVIVQNDKNKKYYLEVKLNDGLSLVSIEDDTANVESSTSK